MAVHLRLAGQSWALLRCCCCSGGQESLPLGKAVQDLSELVWALRGSALQRA